MKRILSVFILSLALAAGPLACTNMSTTEQGVLSGVAIGALSGAGIAAIDGGSGTTAALVGGVAGGIAGGAIGHNAR